MGSFPDFPAMDLEGLHDLSAEELMGKKDSLEAEIRTQNDFLEAVGRSAGINPFFYHLQSIQWG